MKNALTRTHAHTHTHTHEPRIHFTSCSKMNGGDTSQGRGKGGQCPPFSKHEQSLFFITRSYPFGQQPMSYSLLTSKRDIIGPRDTYPAPQLPFCIFSYLYCMSKIGRVLFQNHHISVRSDRHRIEKCLFPYLNMSLWLLLSQSTHDIYYKCLLT